MRNILLASCLLLSFLLGAQEDYTVIQVVGFCASTTDYEEEIIDIVFSENKDQCDPALGFVSIDDQKIHFEESLALKGISFDDFKLNLSQSVKKNREYTRLEAYSYTTKDTAEIAYIVELSHQQFIEVKKIRNPKKLEDFAKQDEPAICAIKDASQRAESIAKHLGFEHCQLVSVDDDTSAKPNYNASMILIQAFASGQYTGRSYPSAYSIIGNFKLY